MLAANYTLHYRQGVYTEWRLTSAPDRQTTYTDRQEGSKHATERVTSINQARSSKNGTRAAGTRCYATARLLSRTHTSQ